ncbi:MAG: proton-conducting transporter membrane subunit [Gammaproteobacteria bacterium]|nr:proton-conducting transporter membrane subunit [Gammaproteobacteria bacterium]MCW8958294.1 proton-conducting transporter membrane subunit [Gammaproteobacteria bacterium]MCW8972899.1 proton-conducting transporter membrane subunit [Gammaproteobacteria bacterium]MCW8991698.1 proton-conducting transporter membrane subunit [Gammaproteobacteria bacterium]
MIQLLLAAAILSPLILALALGVQRWRPRLLPLLPWSALPALLSVVLVPLESRLEWPGVLLGQSFVLDEMGRLFLLLSALLWFTSGLFARSALRDDPHQTRFSLFWLLAMSGNFGLLLAADTAGFYLFFTLMSFSSWVLIFHSQSDSARQAGGVYLALVVLGEGLLLAGLLLAVGAADGAQELTLVRSGLADSPWQGMTLALLLAGFGIKAGLLPLHFWLPLAHTAAPVPASAVLSGAMLKAGLFGWLRFLPLGEVALPGAGQLLLGLGLAGAFFGVVYGLAQRDSKAVLAYSSVSHMGLLSSLIGLVLWQPWLWQPLLPVLLLYALHHALTKGALFLTVGVARRAGVASPVLAVAVLLALSLAGAPYTGGALAKIALKSALPGQLEWLVWSLALVASGTALLMWHFLRVLLREKGIERVAREPRGLMWFGWSGLSLSALPGVWLAAPWLLPQLPGMALWSLLWPLLLALPAARLLWHYPLPRWPNGDLAAACLNVVILRLRSGWRFRLPQSPAVGWRWRLPPARPGGGRAAGIALALIGVALYLAITMR